MIHRFIARVAANLVAFAIAAFGLLVALGFLFAALFLFLLQLTSAPLAAVITAVAALLFAGLAIAAVRWRPPGKRPPVPDLPPGALGAPGLGIGGLGVGGLGAGDLGRQAGAHFARAASANPKIVATAALATGFVVGSSPRLRSLLLDILNMVAAMQSNKPPAPRP